jgi:hypothetical protein
MHQCQLDLAEELGAKEGVAAATANPGSLDQQQGDMARAFVHWTKSLDLYREIGMPHLIEQVEGLIREAGCPEA